MLVTIDTSALIAVIGNEASKIRLVTATQNAHLVAPLSVHWEIGNAFSAMFKRRVISLNQAEMALESYKSISIRFIDVQLERTLLICQRHGLYAYDAYLLQCAEQTNSRLLTLDNALKQVAANMGIPLLEY